MGKLPVRVRHKGRIYVRADTLKTAGGKYQGGFSKEVYGTTTFMRHISGSMVGGYIGASNRTKKRDAILEKVLRATGLGNDGIASWLASKGGRHLMDHVENDTSDQTFTKLAKKYTQSAFKDVAIWSHPDHGGSLADHSRLHDLYKQHFGGGSDQ